jgi:hypothetical protein
VATILTLLFPGYQLQQRKTPPHSNHTGGGSRPLCTKGGHRGAGEATHPVSPVFRYRSHIPRMLGRVCRSHSVLRYWQALMGWSTSRSASSSI